MCTRTPNAWIASMTKIKLIVSKLHEVAKQKGDVLFNRFQLKEVVEELMRIEVPMSQIYDLGKRLTFTFAYFNFTHTISH